MIHTQTSQAIPAGRINEKKEIPFKGVLIVGGSDADYYIAYTMLKRHTPAVSLLHTIDVNSALNVLNSFKPIKDPYLILLNQRKDRQKTQDTGDYVKQFKALLPEQHSGARVVLLTPNARFKEKKDGEEDFSFTEIIEKPFSVEKLVPGLYAFLLLINSMLYLW